MRIAITVGVLFPILFIAMMSTPCDGQERSNFIFWYDAMSTGAGWQSVDLTAQIQPHFHLDSYIAYDDPECEDDVSWWCGTLDYDANGGYGNFWDDRLVLPPVQLTTTVVEEVSWGVIKSRYRGDETPSSARDARPELMPILTFVYRYDTEAGYDFTYVEVESLGVWHALSPGYDGSSGGWQDVGVYGYDLMGCGNPVNIRFRFISDGAGSDEDGLVDSNGGAFHVDNIRIFDFYSGETYFFDDAQDGSSLCTPTAPDPSGDYWHLVDDVCSSNVIPSWWCGDDSDTSLIPPNLANALISPSADISGAYSCTLRYALHAEVPTVDNDYWVTSVIVDGITYEIGAAWGDFECCDGFGYAALNGYALNAMLPASTVQFVLTFYTDDDGCGPAAAGGAGINLDDSWLEGEMLAARRTNWTGIDPQVVRRMRQRLITIPESPYRKF